MTKLKAGIWGLATLTGVALPIFVFAYPLTHSPRYDALEPSLNRFAPLDEFQKVAAQHDIPFEPQPDESGDPPGFYTNFVVPLDGSMWGKTLHLKFRKGDRGDWLLSYAVVVGRDGKERRWWRTRW